MNSVSILGQPDPPVPGSLRTEDTLELTDPPTVKIKLTWIPGYNGGFAVTFRLFFREHGTGNQNFQQENIGASANNMHTFRGLKPQTSYEFTMRAVNEKGESREYLPYHIHRTRGMYSKHRNQALKEILQMILTCSFIFSGLNTGGPIAYIVGPSFN